MPEELEEAVNTEAAATEETPSPDNAQDDPAQWDHLDTLADTEEPEDETPEEGDSEDDSEGEQPPQTRAEKRIRQLDDRNKAYEAALLETGQYERNAEGLVIRRDTPPEPTTSEDSEYQRILTDWWDKDPDPEVDPDVCMADDEHWLAEAKRQGLDPDKLNYSGWALVKNNARAFQKQIEEQMAEVRAQNDRALEEIRERVASKEADEVFQELPDARGYFAEYTTKMADAYKQQGISAAAIANPQMLEFIEDAALGKAYRLGDGKPGQEAIAEAVKAAGSRERVLKATGSRSGAGRPSESLPGLTEAEKTAARGFGMTETEYARQKASL